MRRHRAVIMGAVLSWAALGLSGCTHNAAPPAVAPTASEPAAVTTPQASPAELPAAETIADVLYRLADPAVPGTEKLSLIEGAKPTDADALDKFVTALKGSGALPLTFNASDIAWSDQDPGYAVANVAVSTANPDHHEFSFPMLFAPHGDGWQLSRKTAGMLLTFSEAQATPSSAPTG